jgi:hypothetical protein
MIKALKLIMLKLVKSYHHCMTTYYDRKAYLCRNNGYSGVYYENKAWTHLHKELNVSNKLMRQRGI